MRAERRRVRMRKRKRKRGMWWEVEEGRGRGDRGSGGWECMHGSVLGNSEVGRVGLRHGHDVHVMLTLVK